MHDAAAAVLSKVRLLTPSFREFVYSSASKSTRLTSYSEHPGFMQFHVPVPECSRGSHLCYPEQKQIQRLILV